MPTDMTGFDIDVTVLRFPSAFSQDWLFYPSLQVNFNLLSEWAHGGFQWAGPTVDGSSKKMNWGGGYTDTGGVDHYGQDVLGGTMSIVTPFQWKVGNRYNYRVVRLDYNRFLQVWYWGFWIYHYGSKTDTFIGYVRTRSPRISSALCWIETGYGVSCATPQIKVQWGNPRGQSVAKGLVTPPRGVATYNGTCDPATTNQAVLETAPLRWYQATQEARTTPDYGVLWNL